MNYQFPNIVKKQLDNELNQALFNEKKEYEEKKKALQNTIASCKKCDWDMGCCLFTLLMLPFMILYHFTGEKSKMQKAEVELRELEIQHESTVASINSQYEKKYNDYLVNFESLVQAQSTQFAESELAIEVIEWMTDGFSKTIDAVDRRPHIERIDVPFVFSVYTNKITCNLGTYDFEIKRCSELKSPIQQTALAKAIASAIQVNIMMKYPQDISGTDVSINIEYEYKCESLYENGETKNNEYPNVKITYVAPNGNYQSVKEW